MPKAEALGVESVLDVVTGVYGIEGELRRGGEFYFLCPVHEDHDASASVNVDSGYWSCFSCDAGGDLAGLGKVVLKRRRTEILKLIRPNDPVAIAAAVSRRVQMAKREYLRPVSEKKKEHNPDANTIASYSDGPLDYLHSRGFSIATLEKYGVRYCNEAVLDRPGDDPFTIRDAIAIPIKRDTGETFAYCYRATEESPRWLRDARYIYTPDANLSEIWFGLQLHTEGDIITITEGALDAMWLEQHGFPSLAILGSVPKVKKKIRKLADWREVRLFLDNDNSGYIATWSLGEALTEMGVPVTVVRRTGWMTNKHGQKAKDANDLCGVDLELAWHRAVPFSYLKHKSVALGAA